jgi:DNA-binding MarR family transcriptional regulator
MTVNPPGQDESIEYRIAHKIHLLAHKLTQRASIALAPLNLSMTGYIFLHILYCKGPHSQAQLGGYAGISAAAASKRMQHLLDKGYVDLVINPQNRRQHIVTVTDSGKELLKEATQLIDEAAKDSLSKAKGLAKLEAELDLLVEPFMGACR